MFVFLPHKITLYFRMLLLVILLSISTLASSQEIVKDVLREKNLVSIKPCDLQFTISDHWISAPKGVADYLGQQGFMLGRKGLKDRKGREIIPTITVFWHKMEYVEMDPKKGQDLDPLLVYIMEQKPDAQSKDYNLERKFIWQDGPLTLRYAIGWQYGVKLSGRPSKAIAVYTINSARKIAIHILAEVPEDVWPGLKDELETILKSFNVTSAKAFGKRECFLTTKGGSPKLDFRERNE